MARTCGVNVKVSLFAHLSTRWLESRTFTSDLGCITRIAFHLHFEWRFWYFSARILHHHFVFAFSLWRVCACVRSCFIIIELYIDRRLFSTRILQEHLYLAITSRKSFNNEICWCTHCDASLLNTRTITTDTLWIVSWLGWGVFFEFRIWKLRQIGHHGQFIHFGIDHLLGSYQLRHIKKLFRGLQGLCHIFQSILRLPFVPVRAQTRSTGVHQSANSDAVVPIGGEIIDWHIRHFGLNPVEQTLFRCWSTFLLVHRLIFAFPHWHRDRVMQDQCPHDATNQFHFAIHYVDTICTNGIKVDETRSING